MPGPTFIEGDLTTLRTIEEADLPWMQSVVNDERVWGVGTYPYPSNLESLEEWFEEDLSDYEDGVNLLVAVDDDPIGMVNMFDHDAEAGTAELGYWLDPDHWGEGYATNAAGRLVEYGFTQRALRKWEAKVVAGNDASMRVLEKLGFQSEGVRRENWFMDGEYRDTHWFGLFRDEFDP